MPAGLPEASEAWLSEPMGRDLWQPRKEWHAVNVLIQPLPLCTTPVYLLVSGGLTWPCTGLNLLWQKCLFLEEEKKTAGDRKTLWSMIALCLTLTMLLVWVGWVRSASLKSPLSSWRSWPTVLVFLQGEDWHNKVISHSAVIQWWWFHFLIWYRCVGVVPTTWKSASRPSSQLII